MENFSAIHFHQLPKASGWGHEFLQPPPFGSTEVTWVGLAGLAGQFRVGESIASAGRNGG
ncbi:MAG: hypothetical protein ACAF41_02540 [Leptolyngbya sp. BL-A-14]